MKIGYLNNKEYKVSHILPSIQYDLKNHILYIGWFYYSIWIEFKMSKLGLINSLLQWFFIRLTKHLKKDKEGKYTIIEKYSVQYWILPLTGWWSNFIYLNKEPKYKYLDNSSNWQI